MNEQNLFETPLVAEHIKLGAKMVPFAGWNMPVQYPEGILAEHKHCREKVSLFDICHMGEIRVIGKGAAEALDSIFARSVVDQPVNVARYNFSLNEDGGVRDDLIIYRISEIEFLIVVNAGPKDSDYEWIKSHLPTHFTCINESDETAKLDLQGPLSSKVLESFGFKPEEFPKYYKFIHTQLNGLPILLSRTGYTGELGFEIFFKADKAIDIWNLLLQHPDVKPGGLGARDTLRLEMGYPLYGHEMDLSTTPIEAGFGAMLKLENGRSFIGSDALRNPPQNKKHQKLIGLILDSRRAARNGMSVLVNGKEVGKITSGAFGPSVDKAIAMCYIPQEITLSVEDKIEIDSGRAMLQATPTTMPFYTQSTARIKLVP